ncbi:hypothetical protein CCON61_01390 [Campylobacter concisus]|nr:hypothetical protein CCON61_01390 [Campylobacter concisus]
MAGFADTGRTIGKVFAAVIDFVTKPLQWIIGMIKDIFNFMTDSKLGKWISGKMGLGVGKKTSPARSANKLRPDPWIKSRKIAAR